MLCDPSFMFKCTLVQRTCPKSSVTINGRKHAGKYNQQGPTAELNDRLMNSCFLKVELNFL